MGFAVRAYQLGLTDMTILSLQNSEWHPCGNEENEKKHKRMTRIPRQTLANS